MAGLGLLLYGLLHGAAAISINAEDERMKAATKRVNESGQTVCYGRTGQQYINSEATYCYTQKDKYGGIHVLTIGQKSGRVYCDSWDGEIARIKKKIKEERAYAIENKKLAYSVYDPRMKRFMYVETLTGKRISCLYKGINPKTKREEYRKFYWSENLFKRYGRLSYDMTQNNDMGVVISKFEYNNLYISGLSQISGVPSDPKVLNKLLGTDCFK